MQGAKNTYDIIIGDYSTEDDKEQCHTTTSLDALCMNLNMYCLCYDDIKDIIVIVDGHDTAHAIALSLTTLKLCVNGGCLWFGSTPILLHYPVCGIRSYCELYNRHYILQFYNIHGYTGFSR